MSFLELNGVTIPVASFKERPVDVGSRTRALDGTILVDRVRRLRKWSVQTRPVSRDMADMIRDMISNTGDAWHFDGTLYSAKGIGASGTPSYTFHPGRAADNAEIENVGEISAAKFTTGIAVEDAATNILGADTRDCENAPTGFSAVNGATLAANTYNFLQGTKSLSVTTDSSGSDQEGAETATVSPGVGSQYDKYVASVYLKGNSGAESVSISLHDITNALDGTPETITLEAGVWKRVQCAIYLYVGDCTDLRLRILETNADSGITFYVDCVQCELYQTTSAYPTSSSWVDGSRSAQSLSYPLNLTGWPDALGVNVWIRNHSSDHTADRTLLAMRNSSGNDELVLKRIASGDNLTLDVVDSDGGTDSVNATTIQNYSWKMATVVIQSDPPAGGYNIAVYYNGVVGTGGKTTTVFPTVANLNVLDVGHYNGTERYNSGTLDELLIVPYAPSWDLRKGWNAATAPIGDPPKVRVTGDCVRDADGVQAVARLTGDKYRQAAVSGSWTNDLGQLSFELEEWAA